MKPQFTAGPTTVKSSCSWLPTLPERLSSQQGQREACHRKAGRGPCLAQPREAARAASAASNASSAGISQRAAEHAEDAVPHELQHFAAVDDADQAVGVGVEQVEQLIAR